jgi:hypothetical protein
MNKKLAIVVLCVLILASGIDYLSVVAVYGLGSGIKRSVRILTHTGRTETVMNVTFYKINGVIQNNHTVNLRSINVTATLYNASSFITAKTPTRITLDVLKPEEKVPFEIDVALSSIPVPDHYQVVAQGAETDEDPSAPLEITVDSHSVDNNGYCTIVGKVQNDGHTKAVSVKVTCAFYDQNNNLIAMRHDFPNPLSIGPGGEADFEINSKPFKVGSAEFELFAVAIRYDRVPWENWALLALLIVVFLVFLVYMRHRGW